MVPIFHGFDDIWGLQDGAWKMQYSKACKLGYGADAPYYGKKNSRWLWKVACFQAPILQHRRLSIIIQRKDKNALRSCCRLNYFCFVRGASPGMMATAQAFNSIAQILICSQEGVDCQKWCSVLAVESGPGQTLSKSQSYPPFLTKGALIP